MSTTKKTSARSKNEKFRNFYLRSSRQKNYYQSFDFLEKTFAKKGIFFTSFGKKTNYWSTASIDSRHVESHALFFGLEGTQTNGGWHLDEVIENNASMAIVEVELLINLLTTRSACQLVHQANIPLVLTNYRELYEKNTIDGKSILDPSDAALEELDWYKIMQELVRRVIPGNFTLIVVKNSLAALQSIAQELIELHREQTLIIGVTGSMGKTTTKNMLSCLLQSFAPTISTQGNLNTAQGLAMSILNAKWKKARYAVFECGISYAGEIDFLADMVKPDIALITNVGTAHIGGYASLEQLRKEKLKLAKHREYTQRVFLPQKDTKLRAQAEKFKYNIVEFGETVLQDIVEIHDEHSDGLLLRFKGSSGDAENPAKEFQLQNLIGQANKENIYACFQVAQHLQLPLEKCAERLTQFRNINQRYEIRSKKPLIIDDSYNANLEAMISTLRWFAKLPNPHKVAVLGGMKELGARSQALHKELIEFASSLPLSTVVWVGTEYEGFKETLQHFYSSSDKAIKFLQNSVADDTALILKGSNAYKLGDLIPYILQ